MAIKEKKKGKMQMATRRVREKITRLSRKFDFSCLGLACAIILSGILAINGKCDLSSENGYGFVLWFLLVIGYLPLELLGFMHFLTGSSTLAVWVEGIQHCPGIGLALVDLLLLTLIWLVIRLWAARRYGAEFLHAAGVFIMIFALWGGFQFLCSSAALVWSRGGYVKVHSSMLKRPEIPAKMPQNP